MYVHYGNSWFRTYKGHQLSAIISNITNMTNGFYYKLHRYVRKWIVSNAWLKY